MKIAVFSDVHGNLNALHSVLEQIKTKNVDKTVFLGDIFQRGNKEIECLELLKDSDAICLKGNCELYLEHGVDIDSDVEYLRDYYDGMRKKLTTDQLSFVKKMPLFHVEDCLGHKLHFSHFLFADINAPYPFLQLSSLKNGLFDKACESENIKKYDFVAIGHSHKNFVKGNVISVSASGLEGASYLLLDVSNDSINYERIDIYPEFDNQ